MKPLGIALALALTATAGFARPQRSHTAIAEFKRQLPCPVTGRPTGKCPDYVIDHKVPLCAGGLDAPSNMQWQTVVDAKAKDREEAAQCRALRKRPSTSSSAHG